MITIEQIDAPTPMDLWDLMDRHNLLSVALRANPGIVANMCGTGKFWIWHEDGNPLALQMEFRLGDPEVIDLMLVPEDRWLGKRREEVAELAGGLRERWFGPGGARRVQAAIPASRVNLHRITKSLGFIEETRHDVGLRGGVRLGKKSEGLVLYGLLPHDPIKVYGEPASA